MNAHVFDEFSRQLSTGLPRRRALASLTGAISALLVRGAPPAAAACKKVGRNCDRNSDCCEGAKCQGGECKCKSRYTECDKKCYDLDEDERHCGTCDTACAPGESCVGGYCSEGGYVFVTMWGELGSGDGQFYNPMGIAVTATGRVYVADSGNSRIQIFSAEGDLFGSWGGGLFALPHGIAISPDETVFIADTHANQIQRWDPGGMFRLSFGQYGSGDGEFQLPHGIGLDAESNVYVADTDNHRIQVFTALGDHLLTFGKQGSQDGLLDTPMGVAVTAKGDVLVADSGNARVQVFDAKGGFLAAFGDATTEKLIKPYAVAVDGRGNIVVADFSDYRIKIFDAAGDFITAFGPQAGLDGPLDGSPGTFYDPAGIAVDQAGNLYVAEFSNSRIQRFAPV